MLSHSLMKNLLLLFQLSLARLKHHTFMHDLCAYFIHIYFVPVRDNSQAGLENK